MKFTSTGPKEVKLIVSSFGCVKTKIITVNVSSCQGAFGGFEGFNANPVNKKEVNLKSTTAKAEYDAILNALVMVNFNKSKAAELLNIDRKTLYNKIRTYEGNLAASASE